MTRGTLKSRRSSDPLCVHPCFMQYRKTFGDGILLRLVGLQNRKEGAGVTVFVYVCCCYCCCVVDEVRGTVQARWLYFFCAWLLTVAGGPRVGCATQAWSVFFTPVETVETI